MNCSEQPRSHTKNFIFREAWALPQPCLATSWYLPLPRYQEKLCTQHILDVHQMNYLKQNQDKPHFTAMAIYKSNFLCVIRCHRNSGDPTGSRQWCLPSELVSGSRILPSLKMANEVEKNNEQMMIDCEFPCFFFLRRLRTASTAGLQFTCPILCFVFCCLHAATEHWRGPPKVHLDPKMRQTA